MVLGVQQHVPIVDPVSWLMRRATVCWFLHLKHHLLPIRVDNIVPIVVPRRAPAFLLRLKAGLIVVGLTTDWFLVCDFSVRFSRGRKIRMGKSGAKNLSPKSPAFAASSKNCRRNSQWYAASAARKLALHGKTAWMMVTGEW